MRRRAEVAPRLLCGTLAAAPHRTNNLSAYSRVSSSNSSTPRGTFQTPGEDFVRSRRHRQIGRKRRQPTKRNHGISGTESTACILCNAPPQSASKRYQRLRGRLHRTVQPAPGEVSGRGARSRPAGAVSGAGPSARARPA
ncbi:hypothetical protein CXR04_08540 [Streptomyces sp. CMB-StM0423]|nr:hypothetical protein CXR04_08540 [Streptomyces sp. CMB-StM0423]